MTGPIVDTGRDLVAFCSEQSGFTLTDAAGESYPEAVDAIRAITGSAGGTIPTVPREDKFGTATAVPGIPQKRTAEGSLEGYVMPSGTITTVSDLGADLLIAGGWRQTDRSATTAAIAGVSTTTSLDVDSVTGFQVGDGVLVETTATSELFEARRVTAVTAVGDYLTVEPPLTFTPASGAKVLGAIAYKPNDRRDSGDPLSLTLWLLNNNSADRISSWTPDSFNFTIGGEDAARFTASGTGKRHDRLFQTTLGTQLETSVTTMVVSNALASAGDALNTYWTLSDGGNTTAETVKVTAISGTSWTVTRAQLGTSDPGSPWATSDTEITPYRPTGTYAGSPVPSTSGQIVVSDGHADTVAFDLQCNSAVLDCGFGTNYRTDVHGTTYSVQGYTMAQREVRATLSGWTLRTTSMPVAMRAWETTDVTGGDSQQVGVVVQTGQTEGSIFAWIAPRMRTEDVSLDRGADEVTLELGGVCEGTSSGADEILLIFG